MHPDTKNGAFSSIAMVASTKLAPQSRKGYIKRRNLLVRIEEILACRLTVVHAAAGYGKTSLLSQWLKTLQKQKVATAWLTLEEEEASQSAFIIHVITACIKSGYLEESVLSNIGRVDEKMSLKVLMTIFINAVAVSDRPLVIFLDEYNRIQSDETDSFFRILLRNMPAHVHFVVASRWRPNIDLENLRAHDDLLEITANDLRFSLEEAASLLDLHMSDTDIRQIGNFWQYTEGWPMALQMLRLWLLGSKQRVGQIAEFAEKTTDMARYLTEQVLSELPEDEQDFLMKTAILDRVNGDIANTITNRSDGWLILEQLYERNLFLEPLENDRQWFRFHAVFLEYLRDMLKKRHPDAVQGMHEQAATWLKERGYIRRAIYHAQQAHNDTLAASILSDAGGWRMVMDGRIEIIRAAIHKLADAAIENFPKLLLARVFLLIKAGNIDEAHQRFKQLNTDNNDLWSEQDMIDHKIIENTLSDYADDRVSFEEISEIEALKQQIPKQDHLLHALLSDSLATKCYAMRLFRQTHEACAEAASHYRILQSLYGEMFIRFKQVQAYFAQGRLDEAEVILRQNEKEIDIRLGENTDLAAHNAIFLAELLVERHAFDEAETRLLDALSLIEQADGWFELYAAAYSSAAAIAWQRSGINEVLGLLERAKAVAKSRYLKRLSLLADCETIFYLCQNGQHMEAQPYVGSLEAALETEKQPFHFMSGHIAIGLGIFYLSNGQHEQVDALIAEHSKAAEASGDTRHLIALYSVAAISRYGRGDTMQAAALFDQALQEGLFKGFKQTYINYTYWLLPLVTLILKSDTLLPADRYRTNFLIDLKRDMKNWEKSRLKDENALTIAEIEVLKELVHGFSNKEIALQLGISPNTVKYRLKSIFAKFDVSKRSELVQLVRNQGMVPEYSS
ncbi:LuxR C-terminal-related transcriptional regulator [Kordiimonas pumila]|uniref:LuxR C-terminal-related transcriptional regulator n=1 Tax=Kordiimonas pumila TaxID=2161677 RepID=A0ABV7D7G4_9PROT|nr:LuxR C-terminal-related transcriptional regulator [Kordiimonas pumila]